MGNTKRIAKNTIVLYVRMIITMLIALYSSRIILEALGVDDFGLYNAVGGVVALFAFMRSSLTSATQRFLSYEMGLNKEGNLSTIFSVSLSAHFLIALIIVFFAETIGLWFLNAKISIPAGREAVANWIYQFSVISLVITLITVPYSADVISHERMTFYAVVSIVESILKLLFAFLLLYSSFDRLLLYGGLMMLVNIVSLIMYWIYCRMRFVETKYRFIIDKKLFIKLFSFSGWTLLGQFAVVGANQGTSILINMFHPIAVNAAMGIAQQVNGAITGLTANFQTAFQPQITKSYAEKDYSYMRLLINYASKISFFLLFIVSLPLMLHIDWVLGVWLKEVPVFANVFCVLFIISSIANAISTPLWIAIFATGRIKYYQILVSAVYLIDLVIVYCLFRHHLSPVYAMIVKAGINFLVIFVRMYFANKEVESFSSKYYFLRVIIPCFISALITLAVAIPLTIVSHSIMLKVLSLFIIVISSIIISFYIGLNTHERSEIRNAINSILNKFHI